MDRPQYYPNKSNLDELSDVAREASLRDLSNDISRGLALIAANYPSPEKSADLAEYGNIFTGQIGECLTVQ